MASGYDALPRINDDGMPEGMSQSAASQFIWYQPEGAYGGAHQWEQARGEWLPPPSHHHRSNYRVYQDPTSVRDYGSEEFSVELRVPICCEGCVEKVKARIIKIDGVREVNVDEDQKTVTVSGMPDLNDVFNACQKIFKGSKWRPT